MLPNFLEFELLILDDDSIFNYSSGDTNQDTHVYLLETYSGVIMNRIVNIMEDIYVTARCRHCHTSEIAIAVDYDIVHKQILPINIEFSITRLRSP